MKIPFLNRQRYIVLKAYTWNRFFFEHAPIQIASKDPNPKAKGHIHEGENTFHKCYARTIGAKKSASIYAPASIKFTYDHLDKQGQDHYGWDLSVPPEYLSIDDIHTNDPFYKPDDMLVLKMIMPWRCLDPSGTHYMLCRHLQNKTPMIIPSGVTEYQTGFAVNIFNHLHRIKHEYVIPFREPIASLFPLTDLPFHVESYLDRQMFENLYTQDMTNPYWSNHRVKLKKKMKEYM